MIKPRTCPVCGTENVYAVANDMVFIGHDVAIVTSCQCRSCGCHWQSLDYKRGYRQVYNVSLHGNGKHKQ